MKDSTKKIEYRPVLITYLDILGFRDRIEKTKFKDSKVKETHELLRRLQQQYSQSRRFVAGPDNKPHYITHFRSFSDLMLRVTEIRETYDPLADAVNDTTDKLSGFLNWELVVLANTQCDCVALWGDLLRGAVYTGELYMDDDVTFGPALGEAYSLESGTAIFPRIVIDIGLLKKAKATGRVWESDYIKRGDDGVYFVNYLFGSYLDRYSYPDNVENSADDIVHAHKKEIVKKLREFEDEKDYRKRQKIIWAAQYHNATVRQLVARFKDILDEKHFNGMQIPDHLFQF